MKIYWRKFSCCSLYLKLKEEGEWTWGKRVSLAAASRPRARLVGPRAGTRVRPVAVSPWPGLELPSPGPGQSSTYACGGR